MIFSLVQDFADLLAAMPKAHPRRRVLALLDEAVRRDAHFLDRHPTALFQCLWNSCWWHDCPDLSVHLREVWDPAAPDRPVPPVPRPASLLLEGWRDRKWSHTPGFLWVRSRRPPRTPLATGLLAVLPTTTYPTQVRFSVDGRRLLCLGGNRGREVLDLPSMTSEPGFALDVADGVVSFGRGPDELIAVLPNGPGGRLSAERRTRGVAVPLGTFDGGPGATVALSPDGRLLAVATPAAVKVFRVATGDRLARLRLRGGRIRQVCFAAGGGRLLTATDTAVQVWSWPAGRLLATFECGGPVRAVSPSYDASLVAVSVEENSIGVWELATGSRVRAIDTAGLRETESAMYRVESVSLSPDGCLIAVTHYSDHFHVLDGGRVRAFFGHSGHVYSVQFSPDGRSIASACTDGRVRLWDPRGGSARRRLPNHTNHVFEVRFSPGGTRFASGDYNGWRRTWDTGTGRALGTFNARMGPETDFWFLDDTRLVSEEYLPSADGGPSRRALVVRDVDTGRELGDATELPPPPPPPDSPAFAVRADPDREESVVQDSETARPVGWFPEALTVVAHPAHGVLVGYGYWSVNVLSVEADEVDPGER